MGTNRKIVLVNDEIYHVFNRGVEKRPTFTDKRELQRVIDAIRFYRFAELPFKLSKFFNISHNERIKILEKIERENSKLVEILSFCLMPNHFHLLLKQIQDNGITNFMSKVSNSYAKYFNTKHERIGPLFQGRFKAVHIQTDEQLIHVSRYIHLNPAASFLIEAEKLKNYQWSSYPEYLGLLSTGVSNKESVLSFFKSKDRYEEFVMDQVDYGKKLEQIKHLTLEKDEV